MYNMRNEDQQVKELDDGSLILKKNSFILSSHEALPLVSGASPIKINKVTGNIQTSAAPNIIEYNDTTQYLQHMATYKQ